MTLDWRFLRSWNNSQNNAFEELCCQLAESELVAGTKFVRKAAPDAGVECYAILPDGSEWGWQAKFFLTALDASQWSQITESFKTAIEKHPRLVRYYVCLPIDRQDPRLTNRKSLMEEWDRHVKHWSDLAAPRKIEIIYWGSYELTTRLGKEEHAGRRFFWFTQTELSQAWFDRHHEEASRKAGRRYIKAASVTVPVATAIEALGRSNATLDRIREALKRVAKEWKLVSQSAASYDEKLYENLRVSLSTSFDHLQDTLDSSWASFQSDFARQQFDEIGKRLAALIEHMHAKRDPKKTRSGIDHPEWALYEVRRALWELDEALRHNTLLLLDGKALLVSGQAGCGKTHLFCDAARRRINDERAATILILGHTLGSGELWFEILNQLQLRCTREEFLGALVACAQASGRRALLMFDGINEAAYHPNYPDILAGFLEVVGRYHPYIGVALSVRTTFQDALVPHDVAERLICVTHRGFEGIEGAALDEVCRLYNLKSPAFPVLHPEFSNPLFVHLLCRTLQARGLMEIPSGTIGLSVLFDSILTATNERLAASEKLDFDARSRNVVRDTLTAIANWMLNNGRHAIPLEDAQRLCHTILPREGTSRSLLRYLVDESVLIEIESFQGESRSERRFSVCFQRLQDHLVAEGILALTASVDDVPEAMRLAGIETRVQSREDTYSFYSYKGIFEALSVLVPERYQRELATALFPGKIPLVVGESFVLGLHWRSRVSFTSETDELIARVRAHEDLRQQLLLTQLRALAVPDHPLNADSLHQELFPLSLADRDEQWTTAIHEVYVSESSNPIQRLIDWAWSAPSHVPDDHARLAALGLTWFLTSSNRRLRDRATKALVAFLAGRPSILCTLLRQFEHVNDFYVSERLHAVACGIVLRSSDATEVCAIAEVVEELVFSSSPPPHLLLRDYARTTVEAARCKASYVGARRPIAPPYRSEWPGISLLTKEEIEARLPAPEGETDERTRWLWAGQTLMFSVMSGGDFDRYVIGTNSGFDSRFLASRLTEPRAPTVAEEYNDLLRALPQKLERAIRQRSQLRQLADRSSRDSKTMVKILVEKFKMTEVAAEQFVVQTKSDFERCEAALQKSLEGRGFPGGLKLINNYEDRRRDERPRFQLTQVQRFIMTRVLAMGWTVERFGRFDRSMDSLERMGFHPERIGKKYQWIALNEAFARIADNFHYEENYSPQETEYVGPWQLYRREIDPSLLLRGTSPRDRGANTAWWMKATYSERVLDDKDSVKAWLGSLSGLPDPRQLLIVTDQAGKRWINLEAHFEWRPIMPPTSLFSPSSARRDCQLWMMVKSYLIDKDKAASFLQWAHERDFMGRWMPESHEDHEVYWGEYFWAPCYRHQRRAEMGPAWSPPSENVPFSLMVPVECYSWSNREDDCSLDDGVSIRMPCKDIVEALKLSSNAQEGRWFDQRGELVAFDPNVYEAGPTSFLIREDVLASYLAERNLALVWTILSEKQVLGEIGGTIEACPWAEFSGAYHLSSGQAIGGVTGRIKDYSVEGGVVSQAEVFRDGVEYKVMPAKVGRGAAKKAGGERKSPTTKKES